MQSPNKPLVSVVMPVHNRTQDLKRSIPTIINQTEQSFELLVVDDASTEDIKSVIESFGDARIIYIRKDIKGNAASVRNTGIEAATGRYMAFLDSDDEWFPNHLELRLKVLAEQNVQGTFGSVFVFDGKKETYVQSRIIPKDQHPADYAIVGGSIPPSSWVMVADAAKSILFDPSLVVHEDYDFFVRFSEKYTWVPMWQPTTKMFWQAGADRLRHPYSEIGYVQKYFQQISPRSYYQYNVAQLAYYSRKKADNILLDYFKRECLRYMDVISFRDFSTVQSFGSRDKNFFVRWINFAWLILFRKLRKMPPPQKMQQH